MKRHLAFLGLDWLDERVRLRTIPGVRYALKNGRGEYLCVCVCSQAEAHQLCPGSGIRVTTHAQHAAKFTNAAWLDERVLGYRAFDPTFRTVRLLDFRWN